METEYHPRFEPSGLDCAVCGHEQVVVNGERTAECPSCDESYDLVVRDGFALMEWDGWITRVAVDLIEELPGAVAG